MRLLNAARHWFWLAPAILGIVFIAGGVYMMLQGQDAKDEVRDAIVRENITTSDDSAIPGVLVDDADTAKAEAEVIEKHVLEITGGKTYAELDREDPNRATVLNSVSLRTALNLAVMGFKISDLVTGMGLFMIVLGITHIVFLAPAVYWASEVANQYAAGRAGPTAPAA
ncbi:MAG: aromatic ring-opening dioxygenase LigA [Dehalococcoidia bacterium]